MLFYGDGEVFEDLLLDLIPEVCSVSSEEDTFTEPHRLLTERLGPCLQRQFDSCLLVGLQPGDDFPYVYRWYRFKPFERFELAKALLWAAEQASKRKAV